ncbi:MAG: choice-of-anchor I family protein [Eubacteriales bacterium]|nr:choice-of-anchor I family protein [Eubacteriales bacterium]
MKRIRKMSRIRIASIMLVLVMMLTTVSAVYAEDHTPVYTPVEASDTRVEGYYNSTGALQIELAGRYNSGAMNEDGGSLEIVTYNSANGYAYAVSGVKGKLIAVNLNAKLEGEKTETLAGTEYDVKSLVNGFTYGDMTSVAVSPDKTKLAVAIQAEDYEKNGVVALFSCKTDGSLELLSIVGVGVQPDMVTFSDNDTILTADEGEPRLGNTGTDPKGSVTIIKIAAGNSMTSQSVYFDSFDSKRDELTSAGVLVQKGSQPSVDFEPEYIAVAGNTAYVSLQEANAVAVLNIASKEFTNVYPLGFQNYGETKVDLEKNDTIELKNYQNVYGIKMPDGISVAEIGGEIYLLTANEGDSRKDWTGLNNEYEEKNSPTGNVILGSKVVWFNAENWDGLDSKNDYVFGGRSFSMYKVTANGLDLVFDSGSGFEDVTAEKLPEYFNASNDKISLDNRSGKKGPEPESVVTGTIGGKTYAFIAMERIGGVMVYDITDPANTKFANYVNSREFDEAIKGDVSPEGLCFVPASESKTGNALLLTAYEVSGTLAVYECTCNHSGKLVNVKEATCTENGYSGDKVCTVCGAVIQEGKEVPSLGHKFVSGKCVNNCGAEISVGADTPDNSLTSDELNKEEVKEVTVVKDEKTEASLTSVKKEVSEVATVIATDTEAAAKLVKDGVISEETALKIKNAVEEGHALEIDIVVKDKTAETTEEKEILAEFTEKAVKEVGTAARIQLLDVSVMIKANETELGELHQLKEPITITVAIPSDIKVNGGQYVVLRNHNGTITALETKVNEDGTVSFTTDRFSTYAIAFAEVNSNQNNNDQGASASTQATGTGDESSVRLWILLMMAAVLAVAVIKNVERDSKKNYKDI